MDWNFLFYKKITSTQTVAKELNPEKPTVVVAEVQTSGYGRFKRKWYSPRGGLWCSIVFKPDLLPKHVNFLSVIASLAVTRVIKGEFNITPSIKWPNDILLNNKKVCGILTESLFEGKNLKNVIIGIGVNLNNKIPKHLEGKSISVSSVICKQIDIKEFLYRLLNEFESIYNSYLEGEQKKIIKEYTTHSAIVNKQVKIKMGNKVVKGIVKTINPDGSIKLVNEQEMNITNGTLISYNFR